MKKRWWRWGVVVALWGALAGCGGDRALSQRQFCELVRDRVEDEYPGVLISRLDERGFDYARGSGEQGRMVVVEEYTYYTQHPEALDDLVDRLASLVGSRERFGAVQGDQELLRRSILPVLKPPAFLAEAEARAPGQELLYGQHGTGLLVFYVLDEPTSISYMTTGSLAGLGVSFRQISDLALTNLAQRTGADRFVVERTAEGSLAVSDTRDGYDAARLISPTLLPTLSRVLETASTVVAIPRRDLLLAVPQAEPALIERLRGRARSEFEAGPYPITPELFRVSRDGVQRLDGEEG